MPIRNALTTEELQIRASRKLFDGTNWSSYLRVLLAIPLLCAITSFFVARYVPSNSPLEGSAGYVNDYRYEMKHLDADLLIYGDSSATRNLDPLVIGTDLHMKIANIGGDAQSFRVLGNTPIDYYLKYNKMPAIIVLAAAPWDLPPTPLSTDNSFDGIMMIVRHDSLPRLANFAIAHPIVLLNFTLQVAQRIDNIGDWVHVSRWHSMDRRLRVEMMEHVGFVPQGFGTSSASAQSELGPGCKINIPEVDPLSKGNIATEFVQRFSTRQTTTIVYLAALPDCAGYQRFTITKSPQPWLISPIVVPHNYMVNDSSLIHGRITQTVTLSHLASAAIAQKLKEMP